MKEFLLQNEASQTNFHKDKRKIYWRTLICIRFILVAAILVCKITDAMVLLFLVPVYACSLLLLFVPECSLDGTTILELEAVLDEVFAERSNWKNNLV